MKKLNKPKNFRIVISRTCLGCKYRIVVEQQHPFYDALKDQYSVCARDMSLGLDDSPETSVCDGYRQA